MLCYQMELLQKDKSKNFSTACLEFHQSVFLYAIKNFSIKDEYLKHIRFLNFYDQKCTFEGVLFVPEKLKHVQFTPQQLNELEQEFLLPQTITFDDLPNFVLEEAVICTDGDGNNITYCIAVLWYYISKDNIPVTNKSKFDNLFKLAKVSLCIIHGNVKKESVFSRIGKDLTPRRASLELVGALARIINFQLNSDQGGRCYQYKPSEKVISCSKKVT